MDTNKMRADFEESMKTMTFSVDLSRGNHGCYLSLRTHELYCSWVASWQASRSAVVVELPQVVAYEAGYDSIRDNEYAGLPDRLPDFDYDELFKLHRSDEVREAIEAQGLRVKP